MVALRVDKTTAVQPFFISILPFLIEIILPLLSEPQNQ